jgi:methyl-accepting chemotaxis protein
MNAISRGLQTANETSASFGTIVQGVESCSEIVAKTATASQVQAHSAIEIQAAIGQPLSWKLSH